MDNKNNKKNKTLGELFEIARRSITTYSDPISPPVKMVNDRSPVVELVNGLLQEALENNASDIHVEPGHKLGRLRYRIDGRLEEIYDEISMELYSNVISRIKIMCQLNIAENRLPQDGRFSYEFGQQTIDVRVSIVPLIKGEKVVMRLLNRSAGFMDMDSLDFSPENRERFIGLCREASGAVLMVGPVNSGKTTTLYGALHYLNDSQKNIVTIEDPVEYQLEGINQIQVNTRLKLDFEEALRAVLRQDYDILAIGEVRSEEVAKILIKSGLTGHLVFGSVHTSSAAKAIFRLREMGIKPFMLAIALRGIVAQRLLPRLCPHCCQAYDILPDSDLARTLGEAYEPGMWLYHRRGCDRCNGRGVKGRVAIQEILVMDSRLQQCITREASLQELEEEIMQTGMKAMWLDGVDKAKAGLVELEEVLRVCSE
ncbi:GspE/PulE family protein [uncultured Anaerovibrio sp.]|uniref:GspE/PulE family protein n=1 Tax=uncultured Anaerovibrio sp. TaxID=361586 RepID=UPI002629890E|nr:GspE/PulE family protein [uncultured Anaerovibrio sp.]